MDGGQFYAYSAGLGILIVIMVHQDVITVPTVDRVGRLVDRVTIDLHVLKQNMAIFTLFNKTCHLSSIAKFVVIVAIVKA